MIDDMGRSKNFGDSLREVLDDVGHDSALVVTDHDKRRRVSSEDELESSGDSNAELMGMLRGISSQLTQNSARLDALEVGVKDLPRTDDERQNTNRGGKSAPPASKADKLSQLLSEWNSSAGASPPRVRLSILRSQSLVSHWSSQITNGWKVSVFFVMTSLANRATLFRIWWHLSSTVTQKTDIPYLSMAKNVSPSRQKTSQLKSTPWLNALCVCKGS
jgi:hypothetical protein